MKPIPEFQELAFCIVANNLNPTLLTPEFLKQSGIVPTDWKLAQPLLINSQAAKVTFTNDIVISTRFDTITFSETLETKNTEEAKTPGIVRKYVETLHELDYQTIDINPSSFFTFEEEGEKRFRHYIVTTLLTSGAWQEASREPLTASLNLTYILEQGQFNLKIDDVRLRQSDNSPQPAVLFSGNFSYKIAGETTSERLQNLYQLIERWRKDLETYRDIVNHRFLGLGTDIQ